MPKSTVPAAAMPSEQPPPSDASSLPAPYSDEWRKARKLEERLRFDQLYANWLAARADHANPAHPDDAEANVLRSDWEDETARVLFVTPAVLPWMVWKKIQAFDFYLCDAEGDCQWTDRRHVAFFACIKADLARLGIGDGE
jgi:hypothetical protein